MKAGMDLFGVQLDPEAYWLPRESGDGPWRGKRPREVREAPP